MALRTFEAVVEEGGVLAASRRLNTVQSNVTTRIKNLEEELGVALFHRTGRGLELAAPGRVLLDYARRMLHMERQIVSAVQEAGDSVGELRIGTMETFAAIYLPAALKTLRSQRPALSLRVQTGTTAVLVEEVLAHKLDCAFVAGPVVHPDLVFRPLVNEELVQVHAQGSDPVQLPLLLFREGCAYRARALAWQKQMGHAVADSMEFGTLEGILGCVSVGLGWSLMPRSVAERSLHQADLQLTPIPPDMAHVPIGMIHIKGAPILSALESLGAAVGGLLSS